MFQLNWVCLSVVLVGFVLFLYGANFYEAVVGWLGVFIILGGILAFIILYLHDGLKKKRGCSEPVELAVLFL